MLKSLKSESEKRIESASPARRRFGSFLTRKFKHNIERGINECGAAAARVTLKLFHKQFKAQGKKIAIILCAFAAARLKLGADDLSQTEKTAPVYNIAAPNKTISALILDRFSAQIFAERLENFKSKARLYSRSPAEYNLHKEITARAKALADSLDLEQKICQTFLTSIDGNEEFLAFSARYLKETPPGALILFSRNEASSPQKLMRFITSVQNGIADIGAPFLPLICVDHEGGGVRRFKKNATATPSAEFVGENASPEEARELYQNAALELALLGVNVNLAPVAEHTPVSVLENRIFSKTARTAGTYAAESILASQSAGVAAAVKHFPGVGEDDPHFSAPVLNAPLDELYSEYIAAFKIAYAARPYATLLSHASVPALDGSRPACLSRRVIQQVLRGELGYDGLAISDDLSMEAIRQSGFSTEEAAVEAIRAGCDMAMISAGDLKSVKKALIEAVKSGYISNDRINEAAARVIRVKLYCGLIDGKSLRSIPAPARAGLLALTQKRARSLRIYRAAQDAKETAKSQ